MADADAAAQEPRRFSVLTFNVWFSPLRFSDRMAAVLRIVEAAAPDFVCLQEVLPEFEAMVRAAPFVAREDGYDVSPFPVGRYGVLLLARRAWRATFARHKMPTDMGRVLLSAEVESAGLLVCTAHLESLNSRSVRERQLQVAAAVMAGDRRATVLAGDFNFCSLRNFSGRGTLENDVLATVLPSHVDCWSALHPGQPGYTFDSELNDNIGKFERMRYDRVMLGGAAYKPAGIELVGTEPLDADVPVAAAHSADDPFRTPPPRERQVFPSDHFGLLATFERVS